MSTPKSVMAQIKSMIEQADGKGGLIVMAILPHNGSIDMSAVWFPDSALIDAAERGPGYTEWVLGTAVKSSLTAAIIHGKTTKPGETSVLKILPDGFDSKN